MSARRSAGAVVQRVFETLRARRYAIYAGGVALILVVSWIGPAWSRSPVTVGALTLICTTYLAELSDRVSEVRAEAVVASVAIAGIAGGTYLLVEVSRLGGLLFVLGGLFFFRAAIRRR